MRIAIVDDRPLAAEVIRRVVLSVPGYAVAWTAADGGEAVRKAARDRPDLLLMDMLMPGLNGAEATRQIMATTPCPILVVTASVSGNFGLVYEALGAGAMDAVNTPVADPAGGVHGGDQLLAKIAQVARKVKAGARPGDSAAQPALAAVPPLTVIGASTGGPQALVRLLQGLPTGFPGAVLITQHITPDFTHGLADWLSQQSRFPVRVANPGDQPAAGAALLAGRDDHLVLRADGTLAYTPNPTDTPFRPNVDALFDSVAAHWPAAGCGVLLTGMGRDGAEGLANLRRGGWHTFAQDAASCVVNGMPAEAVKLGAAQHVLPPAEIGRRVGAIVSANRRG